jgi:hypothetical protein
VPSALDLPRQPRASVYVHFPWCLAKCPYCDFVSYAQPREAVDSVAYADAVVRELEARRTAREAKGRDADHAPRALAEAVRDKRHSTKGKAKSLPTEQK